MKDVRSGEHVRYRCQHRRQMGSREHRTPEALLALRQKAKLIAPELLVAECANILWKKVQRQEL